MRRMIGDASDRGSGAADNPARRVHEYSPPLPRIANEGVAIGLTNAFGIVMRSPSYVRERPRSGRTSDLH